RISATIAAMASPDHFCLPESQNSALRSLQPTSAATCAAVLDGQSSRATSVKIDPKVSSSARKSFRAVLMAPLTETANPVRMTKPPNAVHKLHVKVSGKFHPLDFGLCSIHDTICRATFRHQKWVVNGYSCGVS